MELRLPVTRNTTVKLETYINIILFRKIMNPWVFHAKREGFNSNNTGRDSLANNSSWKSLREGTSLKILSCKEGNSIQFHALDEYSN